MKKFIGQTVAKMRLGETVSEILSYWTPEFISVMILITLPPIIDAYIVSNSQSITSYGALAMTTNLLYTLIKMAEAIPVAAIAIIGRFNGARKYEQCGEELGNTFWTTFILGLTQFVIIYFASTSIFKWLNVPDSMIAIGAPFLRWKSLGIFLMFILLSFIGFMRAIKNTKIPMIINILGMATFVFFDYALILGKFGFPKLDLYGSAIATLIQYLVMNGIAIGYILLNPDYKKYFSKVFFAAFKPVKTLQILNLSWPIIIDKATFALCYVWLAKMIAPMGTYAIASYDVVKNLERFAFLPAIAFAQVITFLVSNRLGSQDPDGASASIKKVLCLTAGTVSVALLVMCWNARFFVGLFDPHHRFTDFAVIAFISISLLVVFDYIQVILAGALRGAGDVKAVMWGRLLPCAFFFIPVSYLLAHLPLANVTMKFILVYGAYYLTTGIMSIIFLKRTKSHKWQKKEI